MTKKEQEQHHPECLNVMNYTRNTIMLLLIAAGLSPVLFSSCSTTNSTLTNSGGKTIAAQHYSAAAMGYDDNRPDSPDTFGSPLGVDP